MNSGIKSLLRKKTEEIEAIRVVLLNAMEATSGEVADNLEESIISLGDARDLILTAVESNAQ